MGNALRLLLKILVPAGLLFLGITQMQTLASQRPTEAARPPQERQWSVTGAEVRRADRQPQLTVYGTIVAGRQADVRARVGGALVYLMPDFANGVAVEQGTLLARIDRFDYDQALADAQAALRAEQANLEDAVAAVAGERATLNTQLANLEAQKAALASQVAQKGSDNATLESDRASLEAARANLDAERAGLEAQKAGLAEIAASKASNEAQLSVERERLRLTQAELNRKRELRRRGTGTQAAVDTAEIQVNQMEVSIAAREGGLLELDARMAQQRAGLAQAEARIASLQANVLQAQAAIRRSQAALATRAAGIAQAEAAVTQAETQVDRQRVAIERAQAAVKRLHASVDRAQVAVARAERDLEEVELRAPFTGLLSNTNAALDQQVTTSTTLARLVEISRLEVEFQLSDQEFSRLLSDAGGFSALIGRPVQVHWDLGGETMTYQGQIDRIRETLDSAAGGVDLVASLQDQGLDTALRPGAFVTVRLPDRRFTQVAAIPADALFSQSRAYVVGEDGRLMERAVTPLYRDGDLVYVDGALETGDVVVTRRFAEIGPGLKVEVVNDPKAAADAAQTLSRHSDRAATRAPLTPSSAGPATDLAAPATGSRAEAWQ